MATFSLEEHLTGVEPVFRTDSMDEKEHGFSLRRKLCRVKEVDRHTFRYKDGKDNEPAVDVVVETVSKGLDAGKLCSINLKISSGPNTEFMIARNFYGTNSFAVIDSQGDSTHSAEDVHSFRDRAARWYSSVDVNGSTLDASGVRAAIEANTDVPGLSSVLSLYDEHVAPIVSHDHGFALFLNDAAFALDPNNKMRNATLAKQRALDALRLRPDSAEAHYFAASAEFALGSKVRNKEFVLGHLWEAGRRDVGCIDRARQMKLELLSVTEILESDRSTALDLLGSREDPAAHFLVADDSFKLDPGANRDLILYSLWRAGTLDIRYVERSRDIRNSILGEEEALVAERETALCALGTGTLTDNLVIAEAHYLAARADFGLESKANRDFVLYHMWEAGRLNPDYIENARDVRLALLGSDEAVLEERKVAYDALRLNDKSAEAHYLVAKTELALTGVANAGLVRQHCERARALNASYASRVDEIERALVDLETPHAVSA